MVFEKDIMDYFKIAGMALIPGIILALILGAISSAMASASWLMLLMYGVLLIWAIPNLPKEVDTFFEVLVLAFILMGLAGILSLFVPQISSWLGWINVMSLMGFLNMVVVASLSLAILNKYTSWL